MSETQNAQKDLELIKVEESADGSAVIELPADIPSPDVEEKPAEVAASDDSEGSDEEDEAAREAEMADGGEVDPDQEAVREAKRAKRRARKEYHKQVAAEKNIELQLLRQENQEMRERMAVLERKTHGSEIAQINKAIEDQETRIAFAKAKIKEATENGNGDLLASAQEMWFEARKNHEALQELKKRATAPQKEQTIRAPNPIVQQYANEWMSDNSWYDPNGRDQDSAIALQIDKRLSEEGFNPEQKRYWTELTNRLRKYLPHRYTDDADDEPAQPVRKPRSVVTGSGRENATSSGGKGNTFTLTPEQVRAMKDAGMWDDHEKRMKMIKRYAEAARQQRS